MSLLAKLPQVMEKSKAEFQKLLEEKNGPELKMTQIVGSGGPNILANCDNLDLMHRLLVHDGMAGGIDLIYIDPPFFSGADYGSEIRLKDGAGSKAQPLRHTVYHDTWENGMEEYLGMLAVRLMLMRELLSPQGSLFIHLDWHVVHYVKVLLDEIFGEKNFVNEIIWQYKSGGVSKRYFARKHDTILFYARSPKYRFTPQTEKSYNRGYKPYRFKGVKEYRDDIGWHTMVNMKDVWSIDMVGRTSGERTGYATQKPEALAARILASCTDEGGLAADFFGGSGTLAAAAERMGRHWITCDKGSAAAGKTARRLASLNASYAFMEIPERSRENGRIIAEATAESVEPMTCTRIRVRLKDFDYHGSDSLQRDARADALIREALSHEPLQLIDHWSVDFDYDGRIFRPEQIHCRDRGQLPIEAVKDCIHAGTIALRAVDVFGGVSFQTLRLSGEERS